ncbi:MAG: FecCD family ABC transporter permease [Nanoarchaeota archaeon]
MTKKALKNTKSIEQYKKHQLKRKFFIFLIVSLIIGTSFFALTVGASDISLNDVVALINNEAEDNVKNIIVDIRIPRTLAALLGGMALAVAGAAMQSILRNPLGSPFTLGLSHAAAFGAAFAVIFLGAGSMHSDFSDAVLLNNANLVTLSAFLCSLISVSVILLIAKYREATPETMVLAGIILGSLFTAGMNALQYIADDVELAAIVFWTFGDVGKAVWNDLPILAGIIIPAVIYFIWRARSYNALDAGDETAKSLGVCVNRLRIEGMLIASLASAVVVSFFGIIAFIGLVVPHIVRKIIGGEEFYLLITSALFGAFFLLLADTVARTIIAPIVVPVGILTSFIGAPLFLYLLLYRSKRGYW